MCEHLGVDWSIADRMMVDCRSNRFLEYGIFTHSQQSSKNHMVECCLIYDKCINAKRLFFFFFFFYGVDALNILFSLNSRILSGWEAGAIEDCMKI